MRAFANFTLTIGSAVLFAGCSASASRTIGAPDALPQSVVAMHATGSVSWMLPGAKRPKSILMYAGGVYGHVYVYDYFSGKPRLAFQAKR